MVVEELDNLEQQVYHALSEVDDPEIPGLAITDLGIVTKNRSG